MCLAGTVYSVCLCTSEVCCVCLTGTVYSVCLYLRGLLCAWLVKSVILSVTDRAAGPPEVTSPDAPKPNDNKNSQGICAYPGLILKTDFACVTVFSFSCSFAFCLCCCSYCCFSGILFLIFCLFWF